VITTRAEGWRLQASSFLPDQRVRSARQLGMFRFVQEVARAAAMGQKKQPVGWWKPAIIAVQKPGLLPAPRNSPLLPQCDTAQRSHLLTVATQLLAPLNFPIFQETGPVFDSGVIQASTALDNQPQSPKVVLGQFCMGGDICTCIGARSPARTVGRRPKTSSICSMQKGARGRCGFQQLRNIVGGLT